MKTRLGKRLDNEDMRMLISKTREDEDRYKVRPHTPVGMPPIIRERLEDNKRAPPQQDQRSSDCRERGRQYQKTESL